MTAPGTGPLDRSTSKRVVLLLVLLSAGVLLVSGSREWVHGTVDDAVLGASKVGGTGSQVAGGVLAAALVGAASAVAAATSGRVVRLVAAVAAVLAAVLAGASVVSVLAGPDAILGRLAATSTGRSGTVPTHGSVTVWVWIAVVACVAMALGGVGALVGARRWSGLSSRYDAPAGGRAGDHAGSQQAGEQAGADAGRPAHSAGSRRGPQREESAWDQLSRGQDPTAPEDHGGP